MDVTLFPEYGADKAHRADHKRRMADAQAALFDLPDDIDYVVNDPDQLTLAATS